MIAADTTPFPGVRPERPSNEELRTGYDAYRALVGLLPREVIRPLYRRASRSAERNGDVASDPLALLLDFCEGLLPLPPFEVWRDDLERNPSEHRRTLHDAADAPTAAAPETLEARSFESRGQRWTAHCRAFRDGDAWRGYIVFRSEVAGPAHRTTLIFRESDPAALRERFTEFDLTALEAFLRSAAFLQKSHSAEGLSGGPGEIPKPVCFLDFRVGGRMEGKLRALPGTVGFRFWGDL